MANFTAKEMNIDLVLAGYPETSSDGTKVEVIKTFKPKKRIVADFSEEVFIEWNLYQKAQAKLPESEQDIAVNSYIKALDTVYKDFDKKWVKANFSVHQIKQMFDFMIDSLNDAKKND